MGQSKEVGLSVSLRRRNVHRKRNVVPWFEVITHICFTPESTGAHTISKSSKFSMKAALCALRLNELLDAA